MLADVHPEAGLARAVVQSRDLIRLPGDKPLETPSDRRTEDELEEPHQRWFDRPQQQPGRAGSAVGWNLAVGHQRVIENVHTTGRRVEPGRDPRPRDPGPETRDQRPETQDLDPRPKTWTRDPRPRTRDPRPETWTRDPRPKTWTRDPRPGTRDPRPETRDPGPDNPPLTSTKTQGDALGLETWCPPAPSHRAGTTRVSRSFVLLPCPVHSELCSLVSIVFPCIAPHRSHTSITQPLPLVDMSAEEEQKKKGVYSGLLPSRLLTSFLKTQRRRGTDAQRDGQSSDRRERRGRAS
ncbi:unnamed protein product [Pleuronectes platessa]|uniref:Uncharacterized protein n=1 Tax=Pleuronectes platessa TaxID=8262 RepID=A0A9N7ZE80_PLEPL|nr:unnamed protein product [Pleuronectes platessa]